MEENPYEPPATESIGTDRLPNTWPLWATAWIYGWLTSLLCVGSIFAMAIFRPFGVFDDFAPRTAAWWCMVWVRLLLFLGFWAGLVAPLVAGVWMWLRPMTRDDPDAPSGTGWW